MQHFISCTYSAEKLSVYTTFATVLSTYFVYILSLEATTIVVEVKISS